MLGHLYILSGYYKLHMNFLNASSSLSCVLTSLSVINCANSFK
nr:MAG TPA: hypothetical protein [Caudoviricetes sp.]